MNGTDRNSKRIARLRLGFRVSLIICVLVLSLCTRQIEKPPRWIHNNPFYFEVFDLTDGRHDAVVDPSK